MKTYTKFVSQFEGSFDTQLKIAQDLARLLDDACMVVPKPEERNFSATDIAMMRLEAIESLRVLCEKACIEPPEMELGLYSRIAVEDKLDDKQQKELDRISNAVSLLADRAAQSNECTQAESLLAVIRMIPALLSEWRGPKLRNTLCALNHILVTAGEPALLLHEPSDFKFGTSIKAPSREIKVLIVDDDQLEIARSYFALIGCPNTILETFWVPHEELEDPVEIEERLKIIAQDVLKCKPDIVLMDQGMPPFSGSGLIDAINDVAVNRDIFFVGNTGGSPQELQRSGAYGNFEKGRGRHCIMPAFRHFA